MALSRRLAAAGAFLVATAGTAHAVSPDVVISQIYGGGGNAGATLTNDFIEVFNRGSVPVSVAGWSVQYAAAGGTTWQRTNLPSVTLAPGQYLLVQESQGAGGTQPLPTPDAIGNIAMAATSGKVALLTDTTLLTCGTSADCLANPAVRDLVGFGTAASAFEGTGPTTPNLANTTAALRLLGGCTDTDQNGADFSNGAPAPRNSTTPPAACGAVANAPVVASCPASFGTLFGIDGVAALHASDADGAVTSAALAGAPVAGISLVAFTPSAAAGEAANASLDVAPGTAIGTYNVQVQFGNADALPQTALCSILVTVANPTPSALIHDIQGRGHISPLNGQTVSNVPGIVTALRSNGFYMQDPTPDADPGTSDGIFVFTSSAPTALPGDSVRVSGRVSEFRPGGTDGLTNLTATEIVNPVVVTLSRANALPAPVIVGIGGRIPPSETISPACGNVEVSPCTYDPGTNGIDFWESLEGMRVQINNAFATGPTNSFGETSVIADGGIDAGPRTARGGVRLTVTDANPERVFLDDEIVPLPKLNLGDFFPQVIGVMDYGFGNFHLQVTEFLPLASGGLAPESTVPQAPNQLAIASFNVENLAPTNPPEKFGALAAQIVGNLKSPDIVALMEIQDNNGAINNGVVDSDLTVSTLIGAIVVAGGPQYQFRSINPVDGQDGGEPGGNIRQGFLFNPERVAFVDRAGGSPTAATAVAAGADGPQLSFSPGRIDPANAAFTSSRKPLAGEFLFNGHRLFLIANHFNSKGGDQPLFGRFQPPALVSEAQRVQQATVVGGFVQSILALDANAKIVVLGDLNDFEFSAPVGVLKGAGLNDLVETLAPEERYTYVFEGNSQVLDHILVSNGLKTGAEYDIVHVNSEFAVQASDHEPEVARLNLPPRLVDVTAQVKVASSRLRSDNRGKGKGPLEGTITVKNIGTSAIAAPLQVELGGLEPGVLLVNATGTHEGAPFLTSASALAAGASVTLPVRFTVAEMRGGDRGQDKDRGRGNDDDVSYTARVFSGTF